MSGLTIEEVFEIIDSELEKRKEHTFLLWDFPNDVKKRIEELDNKKSNLKQELGCPLEVVLKALKDGICIKLGDEYEQCEIDGWRIGVLFEEQCFIIHEMLFRTKLPLEDYKKTWWLKGDMEHEKY